MLSRRWHMTFHACSDRSAVASCQAVMLLLMLLQQLTPLSCAVAVRLPLERCRETAEPAER